MNLLPSARPRAGGLLVPLLGERKKRIVTTKLDHQQQVGAGAPFMTEYHAGRLDELKEHGRLLVRCGDAEIGIFLVDGELHAWHNECAHRGGPVCQGRIRQRVVEPVASDGTVRTMQYHAEDTHIVCPWHGYEYNIRTGEHPGHAAFKLRKAGVSVRDGEIYVVPG